MSAASVCYLCDLIWSGGLIVGCTYLVFAHGQSGWWFVLAIWLAGSWKCAPSPPSDAKDTKEGT